MIDLVFFEGESLILKQQPPYSEYRSKSSAQIS